MSNPRRLRSDEDTEQLVYELRDRVRELNYATMSRPGLTLPSTAYTILGGLVEAEQMLIQTFGQVSRFLAHEMAAYRIGHDDGQSADESIEKARFQLAYAQALARDLSEALGRAQNAVAFIHALPEVSESDAPEAAASPTSEFPKSPGEVSGEFDDPPRPLAPGSRPSPRRRS